MHPWLHFKTITRHKLLVMKYCFRIGLYKPVSYTHLKNNVKSLCSFCIFIITFDVGKNWISCFCTGEFIKIYLSTLILAIFVQRQQRNVFLLFYWKYGQNCTFDLSVIVQRQCNGVVTCLLYTSARIIVTEEIQAVTIVVEITEETVISVAEKKDFLIAMEIMDRVVRIVTEIVRPDHRVKVVRHVRVMEMAVR